MGESAGGDGMNWPNETDETRGATFESVQEKAKLYGLAALCLRARLARNGPNNPTHLPPKDGRGDFDSTPASGVGGSHVPRPPTFLGTMMLNSAAAGCSLAPNPLEGSTVMCGYVNRGRTRFE